MSYVDEYRKMHGPTEELIWVEFIAAQQPEKRGDPIYISFEDSFKLGLEPEVVENDCAA